MYGNRIVGEDFQKQFRPYWSTTAHKNFIRLTPDRQSKKGALFTFRPIQTPSFTTILQFRISGKGERFFGDGLGLWIIHHFQEGHIQGLSENFNGVGIIVDTFKNTETFLSHRDVMVLVNDGTKTYEDMIEEPIGCSANLRYHEDRDDFSVDSSSRLKVVVHYSSLEVFIDETNSGKWLPCASVPNVMGDKHGN